MDSCDFFPQSELTKSGQHSLSNCWEENKSNNINREIELTINSMV